MASLKAKNSWGKNRPDCGLIDGYTSFDSASLQNQFSWLDCETCTTSRTFTTLENFVLPPGY